MFMGAIKASPDIAMAGDENPGATSGIALVLSDFAPLFFALLSRQPAYARINEIEVHCSCT
jgi:hypothetical protein